MKADPEHRQIAASVMSSLCSWYDYDVDELHRLRAVLEEMPRDGLELIFLSTDNLARVLAEAARAIKEREQ